MNISSHWPFPTVERPLQPPKELEYADIIPGFCQGVPNAKPLSEALL